MLNEYLNLIRENKKIQRVLVVLVLALLAIILFIFLTRTSYPTQKLYKVELNKQQSFNTLSGEDLLVFNGLAFYKTNVATQQSTVLRSGIKLPQASAVYWNGSKGAAMSFNGSFTYTKIEEILRSQGLAVTRETMAYTWYIDFTSGNISLLSVYPVASGTGYFNDKDQFIYAADNSRYASVVNTTDDEVLNTTKPSVRIFDVKSGKDSELRKDIGLVDVSSVAGCPDPSNNGLACILGNAPGGKVMRLQAIDSKGNMKTLVEKQGALATSNDPDVLFSLTPAESKKSRSGEEDAALTGEAALYTVTNKKESKLGFNVDIQNFSGLQVFDEGHFYMLDNQLVKATGDQDDPQTTVSYHVGKLSSKGKAKVAVKKLGLAEGQAYIPGFRQTLIHGSGDLGLTTAVNGNTYLISSQPGLQNMLAAQPDGVKKILDSCTPSDKSEILDAARLVRLIFEDVPGWQDKLVSVSNCISKDGTDALFGYNYQVMLVDARNGRFVNN